MGITETFNFNDSTYYSKDLSDEGKRVLIMIQECQKEIAKLETKNAILQAANQKFIEQLKTYLPEPITQKTGQFGVTGTASNDIPTTSAYVPDIKPASMPKNIPREIEKG